MAHWLWQSKSCMRKRHRPGSTNHRCPCSSITFPNRPLPRANNQNSSMSKNTYTISVIPGDGIGKEVVPAGLRVLDAVSQLHGFKLQYKHYDWSCETYKATGKMMPDDGIERLRDSDAIFLGAVGFPGVPDHISLWNLLIPIRDR